jgi:pseudouridine kinase
MHAVTHRLASAWRKPQKARMRAPDILCIGSAHWDIIGRSPAALHIGSDEPGRITRLPGGVALNIARTLAGLGLGPALLSAVGRDSAGESLIAACRDMGVNTDHIHRPAGLATDSYIAIEGANGLIAAIADAQSLEAAGAAILLPLKDGSLASAAAPYTGTAVLDCNLTEALLADMARSPIFAAADLRVVAVGSGKAARLAAFLGHPRATLYLNLDEAQVLCGAEFGDAAAAADHLLERGAARVLVTDGARPCADAARGRGVLRAVPPPVVVARVTGAGDTFVAAHIVAERRGAGPAAALAEALCTAAAFVAGKEQL